jgi:hypothetical protein
MAFVHGKNTYVSLDGDDLSAFTNSTDFERNADEHDVTTYGQNAHVLVGGLLGGSCSISGVYDNGATGPRKTIEPLIGTVVGLVHRPEGTGSGKPEDTVDVLVKSYKESNPVADMVQWSADLSLSGDVVTAAQGA